MIGHVAHTCRYCDGIHEWAEVGSEIYGQTKSNKNTVNYNICVRGYLLWFYTDDGQKEAETCSIKQCSVTTYTSFNILLTVHLNICIY